MILESLRSRLRRVANSREPDRIVGTAEDPYLYRWYVIPRNAVFNVYLHKFMRSDDDRALHDHPWINVSILLEGSYVEHTIRRGGVHVRTNRSPGVLNGGVKVRLPWAAHRVELYTSLDVADAVAAYEATKQWRPHLKPCWTLFITGPRIRKWGFHCRLGWKPWDQFVKTDSVGEIGEGCGDLS